MKIHNIDEFANPKMTKIPDLASCDLLSGYDSPIKIIATQMEAKMENDILTAVQHFDINVNKDELIKALDYDRKQYEAGYQAGYNLNGTLSVDNVLSHLEESQAKAQRHKSPHAAFALGYYHGVCQRTNDDN